MNFLRKLFCKHEYKVMMIDEYIDRNKKCNDVPYSIRTITTYICNKCGKIKIDADVVKLE